MSHCILHSTYLSLVQKTLGRPQCTSSPSFSFHLGFFLFFPSSAQAFFPGPLSSLDKKRLTACLRAFKAPDPASKWLPIFSRSPLPSLPSPFSFPLELEADIRWPPHVLLVPFVFFSSGILFLFCPCLFQAVMNFTALIRVCSGADCSS